MLNVHANDRLYYSAQQYPGKNYENVETLAESRRMILSTTIQSLNVF